MTNDSMISPENDSGEDFKAVLLGSRVHLRLVCESGVESISFELVPDSQADFDNGFLSINTPLAKAILNHYEGETIKYQMGDIHAIYIENITPGNPHPMPDNKAKREEIIRKAVAESERTNAIIFASSFSGKWGDYDPSNIMEDW